MANRRSDYSVTI